MPIEQITVAYVNPPKDGAKKGSVKDMHGRYFGVWPDKLAQYEKGQTYEVEYDTQEYNGKTYRHIKRIVSGAASGGGTRPAMRAATSDSKSVEMAVMGIIGRAFHGTGMVPDEASLTAMVRTVRLAWENGFKDIPKPSLPNPYEDMPADENEQLNDEIPF